MKLLLMRHGAAASPPGYTDRERPLNNRGRGQSLRAGEEVGRLGLIPDRVVLSTAVRVRETWEAFALGLDGGPQVEAIVESDSRVYDNTLDDLLDILRETRYGIDVVLVIGHNPSISGLAGVLDENEDNYEREKLADGFPTGTVTVFDVDGEWSDLREGGASLSKAMVRL